MLTAITVFFLELVCKILSHLWIVRHVELHLWIIRHFVPFIYVAIDVQQGL